MGAANENTTGFLRQYFPDLPCTNRGGRRQLMLVLGLALQVTGSITAVAQVSRTEFEPPGPVEEGDRTLRLVGILGFGLGGVLSLITVIGLLRQRPLGGSQVLVPAGCTRSPHPQRFVVAARDRGTDEPR